MLHHWDQKKLLGAGARLIEDTSTATKRTSDLDVKGTGCIGHVMGDLKRKKQNRYTSPEGCNICLQTDSGEAIARTQARRRAGGDKKNLQIQMYPVEYALVWVTW